MCEILGHLEARIHPFHSTSHDSTGNGPFTPPVFPIWLPVSQRPDLTAILIMRLRSAMADLMRSTDNGYIKPEGTELGVGGRDFPLESNFWKPVSLILFNMYSHHVETKYQRLLIRDESMQECTMAILDIIRRCFTGAHPSGHRYSHDSSSVVQATLGQPPELAKASPSGFYDY